MTENRSGTLPSDGVERRRGFGKWRKRILIAAVLIATASLFLIPAYHGFRPRALTSEALADGAALKFKVAEFYESHQRLPLDAEARALQVPPSELKRAQSVVWEFTGRRVVITAGDPQAGKRFALNVEERDGRIDWTCRTIDLDVKYLPASCR